MRQPVQYSIPVQAGMYVAKVLEKKLGPKISMIIGMLVSLTMYALVGVAIGLSLAALAGHVVFGLPL